MDFVNEIYACQREAFSKNRFPDYAVRITQLQRLENILLKNTSQIVEAINVDYKHRSVYETRIAEIFPSIECIKYNKRHLKRWMKTKRRPLRRWFFPASARVQIQPLGVVGIMVPWNYPLYLAIAPLASAIAAGNRVMLKMSELTPCTGELLQNFFSSEFAKNEIAVINGDLEIAKSFSKIPFDHLFFTGSTNTGKQIMRNAAENLTPVTLELGGKSPCIIGPDVGSNENALKSAVAKIMVGKLLNAGQTCIAPDYVLLPTPQQHQFIELAKQWIKNHYPNIKTNPDYSNIINSKQMIRLQQLSDDANNKGATIVSLTDQPASSAASIDANKLLPTAVLNVTPDMRIDSEEIFGPILPIICYQELTDAITYINSRPKPLALYYFGNNEQDIKCVLKNTISGGVTINDTLLHAVQDALPFGGVGASGIGQYHGKEGFYTFSKQRGIFYQSRWSLSQLFYPPYTKLTDKLLKWLLGV